MFSQKIHKSKDILKGIQENSSEHILVPMPFGLMGRPINGDVNFVTQGISKLLEKILKPLVLHQKSYIRDEFDFANKIPRNV